jgi:hypothetical protein
MCADAFGMPFDIEANIQNTNMEFGSNILPSYYATNIATDTSG